MPKCTASVKELLDNVKETPFGVEVKKSKNGKPQAISFNETLDHFEEIIEEDCRDADKYGRYSDTPGDEGGARKACEMQSAEEAPCFLGAGKIKSSEVLKKRIQKKYREKDAAAGRDEWEEHQAKEKSAASHPAETKGKEKRKVPKRTSKKTAYSGIYTYWPRDAEGKIGHLRLVLPDKFLGSLDSKAAAGLKEHFTKIRSGLYEGKITGPDVDWTDSYGIPHNDEKSYPVKTAGKKKAAGRTSGKKKQETGLAVKSQGNISDSQARKIDQRLQSIEMAVNAIKLKLDRPFSDEDVF